MNKMFYNGNFKTDLGYAEAVCCRDEIITFVGTNKEARKKVGDDGKMIDLHGYFALPGFNDSHMHFLDKGSTVLKYDLTNASSIKEVIEGGKRFIDAHDIGEGSWLQAFNWNDANWIEKRRINRYDLDRISTDVPIVAVRVCGHIETLNSKGLELVGINRNTPQPEDGSRFDVDENGEPNGVLHELYYKVMEKIPAFSIPEIKKMIQAADKCASSNGLTSVQTDDLSSVPTNDREDVIKAYFELVAENKLSVRVTEQSYMQDIKHLNAYFDKGYYYGYGNNHFRLGPIKLIADGSLGGRTAWMLEDYSDMPGERGLQIYSNSKDINELVIKAHSKGSPVVIHCIGDAAANQAINAIEAAIKTYPDIHLRHGIVHAQTLNMDLCKRMETLGIMALIQPIFIQSDMYIAEERLGKKRLLNSYNWRTLANMGIIESMGTDCPVEDMDPISNIYSAVTRRSINQPDHRPWIPEESLTVGEAIDFYTKASAYASGEENDKGKIKEGYLADMTVIDGDIYSVTEEAIKDIRIKMTIVGGKITYSNITD